MRKIIINEDEYIDACNDELKDHPDYGKDIIISVLNDSSGVWLVRL